MGPKKLRGIQVIEISSVKCFRNKEFGLPNHFDISMVFEILVFEIAKFNCLYIGVHFLAYQCLQYWVCCFVAIRDAVSAESDCFACVISSHGMEGQVRTSTPGVREPFIRTEHSINTRDGVVSTNKLLELFNDRNCRPLKGKPKMFFIQVKTNRTKGNRGGTERNIQ